ncbi:MAG: LysE family transporter [Acidobacteriota bacterium]
MEALLLGLSFGFASGFSPGPLFTLVITSTLERGLGAGLRVSLAPLVTDAPIILLSVLFLRSLPPSFLTVITIAGAGVVFYLAFDTLRTARRRSSIEQATAATKAPRDLLRAVLVNGLSPHPWLFWVSIGGPALIQAWRRSPVDGSAFLLGFFPLLVGAKMLLAWLAARGRPYLKGPLYGRVLTACGLLLLVLGVLLLRHAVR